MLFAVATLLLAPSAQRADTPVAATSGASCELTQAIVVANRALEWATFDLAGQAPGSAMWLSARKCYAEAVAAAADYLANGPHLDVRQHAITTFHMARNLARTGDHAGAARLAAASRRSDQSEDASLDWNTYVTGFYAYLIGDSAGLDQAHSALVAKGGEANLTNARVLARARRCFSRPFAEVETAKDCTPD